MRRVVTWALSTFKYILALFMMYAGVTTMLATPSQGTDLSFVYEKRLVLVAFGLVFFFSGLVLFVGKILHKRALAGYGLFMIYACFTFTFFLTWIGLGLGAALGNGIGALVVGALYLRWKYHIYYYEPSLDRVREAMLESEPLDDDRNA